MKIAKVVVVEGKSKKEIDQVFDMIASIVDVRVEIEVREFISMLGGRLYTIKGGLNG